MLQHRVQRVPRAFDGGHAAKQIRREFTIESFVGVSVLLSGIAEGPCRSQMHVDVDQAREQRLAGGVNGLRLQTLRIGSLAREYLSDLPVLNQHRALFDDGSIAQEQPRVANQKRAASIQVARQNLGFRDIVFYVRLPDANRQERRHHRQQP